MRRIYTFLGSDCEPWYLPYIFHILGSTSALTTPADYLDRLYKHKRDLRRAVTLKVLVRVVLTCANIYNCK